MQAYRQTIGREYDSNSRQWDILAEREWKVIEENLHTGFGVAEAVKRQLEKIFERKLAEMEINIVSDEVEYVDYETNSIPIYTISDFIMLSNQGIFRADILP